MQCQSLPQIWSPQQEVFTKTALEPQRGADLGFRKHSSVRVWLLHVHRWQADCHTSPGWGEKIKFNLELQLSLLVFVLMKQPFSPVWALQGVLYNLWGKGMKETQHFPVREFTQNYSRNHCQWPCLLTGTVRHTVGGVVSCSKLVAGTETTCTVFFQRGPWMSHSVQSKQRRGHKWRTYIDDLK